MMTSTTELWSASRLPRQQSSASLLCILVVLAIALQLSGTLDAAAMVRAASGDGRVSCTSRAERTVGFSENRLELAQYGIPANACCTSYAPCQLMQALPVGYPCSCYSPYGPIRGYACRL
jgi:hypothetical protein